MVVVVGWLVILKVKAHYLIKVKLLWGSITSPYLHSIAVGMVSPLNFVLLAQMILPLIDPNFSQSKTLGSGLFSPSKALPHTEKLYAHSCLPSNGLPPYVYDTCGALI